MANEKRLIDANALVETIVNTPSEVAQIHTYNVLSSLAERQHEILNIIDNAPTIDAVPVVHGRWLYEAHRESSNYRWNVTAECSECCDEKKEIWAGFFPNVPDWLARDVAMQSAKSVKLSNYCPNCGAKMDGERKDNEKEDS